MATLTPYVTSTIVLNGLSLSSQTAGLELVTETLQGWGSTGGTVQQTQKPRGHGAWSGESFLKPRTLVVGGYLVADDPVTAQQGMDTLINAVSLDPMTMAVTETGRTRFMTVRRDADDILAVWQSPIWCDWSVGLIADDPRKYDATVTPNTGLPTTTGGLVAPLIAPLTSNATTTSGIISITNLGNVVSPVTLRIDGPCQAPAVTRVVGSTVTTWGSTYTIASGNYLLVDMQRRQVLESGQTSRNYTVNQHGWFGLDPGVNQFYFTASAYNSSALLTVTTASAWE